MPSPQRIKRQIDDLVKNLIEYSLNDDQNFPFIKRSGSDLTEISFHGAEFTSIAMKNISYKQIYDQLKQERAYLIKMLDGALIQMMYAFQGKTLERHRLAFFPSPYLEEFQNSPEIYLEDEIYADIVAKNVVPFPLRFDFDAREEVYQELDHPKSHLTLGQYTNCRIPVSAPLMPAHFVEFVLRNFYHTAHQKYCEKLDLKPKSTFVPCISQAEKKVVHLRVPH